jgi:type 1 glutamine amidotransferase
MKNLFIICLSIFVLQSATGADKPRVLFLEGEYEYGTRDTLPKFAKHLRGLGIESSFVHAKSDDRALKDCHIFPGFREALKNADLLFISVRRRYPLPEDMAAIRAWIKAGKPVMGIRTASHPFASRPKGKGYQPPEGHVEWQDFDQDVLGADYTGHYRESDGQCLAQINPAQKDHPILKNVVLPTEAKVPSHLYRSTILDTKNTAVVLNGVIKKVNGLEPIAWARTTGSQRVFYTSLGGVEDMALPWVQDVLANAVFWSLNKEKPLTQEDVVGNWKLAVDDPDGNTHHPYIRLRLNDGTLEGTYTAASDNREYEALKVKLTGNVLSFVSESFTWTVTYRLNVAGDDLKGKMIFDIGGLTGETDIAGSRVRE